MFQFGIDNSGVLRYNVYKAKGRSATKPHEITEITLSKRCVIFMTEAGRGITNRRPKVIFFYLNRRKPLMSKKILSAIIAIAMVVSILATGFVASTGAAVEASDYASMLTKYEQKHEQLFTNGPFWSMRATIMSASVGLLKNKSGAKKGLADYYGESKSDLMGTSDALAARNSILSALDLLKLVADDGNSLGFFGVNPKFVWMNGLSVSKGEFEFGYNWGANDTGVTAEDFLKVVAEFNKVASRDDKIDTASARAVAKIWGASNWAEAYAAFGLDLPDGIVPAYNNAIYLADQIIIMETGSDAYATTLSGEAAFYTWFMNLLVEKGLVLGNDDDEALRNTARDEQKVLNARVLYSEYDSSEWNSIVDVIALDADRGAYSSYAFQGTGNVYNQMGVELLNSQLGEFIVYADSVYYFLKRAIEENMDAAVVAPVAKELQVCIDVINTVLKYLEQQVRTGYNKPGAVPQIAFNFQGEENDAQIATYDQILNNYPGSENPYKMFNYATGESDRSTDTDFEFGTVWLGSKSNFDNGNYGTIVYEPANDVAVEGLSGYAAELYNYKNWVEKVDREDYYDAERGFINLYALDQTGRYNVGAVYGWTSFAQIRNIPELKDYFHVFETALKNAENYRGNGVLYTDFYKIKGSVDKAWNDFVTAVNAYLSKGFIDTTFTDSAAEEAAYYGDLVKILEFYENNLEGIYSSSSYFKLNAAVSRAETIVNLIKDTEELDPKNTYIILKGIGNETFVSIINDLLSEIAALDPAADRLEVSQSDLDEAYALIRKALFIQQYKNLDKATNEAVTELIENLKSLLPTEAGVASNYVIAKDTLDKKADGVHYEYGSSDDYYSNEDTKSNLNHAITIKFNLHYFSFINCLYTLEDVVFELENMDTEDPSSEIIVVPEGSSNNGDQLAQLAGRFFFLYNADVIGADVNGRKLAESVIGEYRTNQQGLTYLADNTMIDANTIAAENLKTGKAWDYGFNMMDKSTWAEMCWWYFPYNFHGHHGENNNRSSYEPQPYRMYTDNVKILAAIAFGEGTGDAPVNYGYAYDMYAYFLEVLGQALSVRYFGNADADRWNEWANYSKLTNGQGTEANAFTIASRVDGDQTLTSVFYEWDKKYDISSGWDWENETMGASADVLTKVRDYVLNLFGYLSGKVSSSIGVVAYKVVSVAGLFDLFSEQGDMIPARFEDTEYAHDAAPMINTKYAKALHKALRAAYVLLWGDVAYNTSNNITVSAPLAVKAYEDVLVALKAVLTERGIQQLANFEADVDQTSRTFNLADLAAMDVFTKLVETATPLSYYLTVGPIYNNVKVNAAWVMDSYETEVNSYFGQLMWINVVRPIIEGGMVLQLEDVAVYDWQYAMNLTSARQKIANISTLFSYDLAANQLYSIRSDVPLSYLFGVVAEVENLRVDQDKHSDPYLADYAEEKLAALIAEAHGLEVGVYADNGLSEAMINADTIYYSRKSTHNFSVAEKAMGYNKCLPTAEEIDAAAEALAAAIKAAKDSYLGGSKEEFEAIVAEARAICAQYTGAEYAELVAAVEKAIADARTILNYNDLEYFTANVTWVKWNELIDSINKALAALEGQALTADELALYADAALANHHASAYTEESYKALTEAVAAAKAVAAKGAEATVSEIAAAKRAIDDAIANLVKTDISEIMAAAIEKFAELKAEFEALNEKEYDAKSYKALKDALDALEAGINNKVSDDEILDLLLKVMNSKASLKNVDTCDD